MRDGLVNISVWVIAFCLTSGAFSRLGNEVFGQDRAGRDSANLKLIVRDAYVATHDGWSSDEVLLQDSLNQAFLAACHARYGTKTDTSFVTDAEWNWMLLNLRKAGDLPGAITKRRRDNSQAYLHVAEIAARAIQDRHGRNTDRMLCDPGLRAEFEAQARTMGCQVDGYLLRKGALGLRKARRLRPELVLRIADWGRQISEYPVGELVGEPTRIPELPGVYIFRDATGYLYIGEASNLRERIREHLEDSDRPSLGSYLRREQGEATGTVLEIHAFPADSRGNELVVRRAYESELIASRRPRFNVRP